MVTWTWLFVFLSLVALDFVWAKYTQAITDKKPINAGLYAILILALGGFSIISYTTDHMLLIPACAGAFVGTYLAVRFT
jgi:hypothetical protein